MAMASTINNAITTGAQMAMVMIWAELSFVSTPVSSNSGGKVPMTSTQAVAAMASMYSALSEVDELREEQLKQVLDWISSVK